MSRLLVPILCGLLLLLAACSEQEPQGVAKAPVAKESTAKEPVIREVQVVVPESVAGKWKSVKIALHDQHDGSENTYRVDIGGSFQIPGTAMRVSVQAFMPAFSANSERATSVSNQATNPAVQIVVRDGGKEIHRGWVFALYPERHQFNDPRYKFILLDYKPAD